MELAAAISAFPGLGVTAGQFNTKLSTLAYQIRFLRDQILRLARDVSVAEGYHSIAHRLAQGRRSSNVGRFWQKITVSDSKLEEFFKEASKQIKTKGLSPDLKITLSQTGQALWSFHHDKIDPVLKELDFTL